MGGGGRRRRGCFPFFLCALSGHSFAMGLVLFFCSFEQNPMGGLTGPPSIRAHLLLLYPFSASWKVVRVLPLEPTSNYGARATLGPLARASPDSTDHFS